MNDFLLGQRWSSDTESKMGLGTVVSIDQRTVTILFLSTGETRIYSKQTAPLTRVQFNVGDSAQSHEGWSLKVESIEENEGLYTYIGTLEDGSQAELEEGQLDNFIQLNRTTDRLFTGQIDQDKLFELRYQTHQQVNRLSHSDLRGLTGCRTSLIPHQLYIAHEVANRYAPRVLLADEVGLGKTIEAGLILHHQLLTERAHRVLIVVPETLIHQWLVEMLRRFNLHFSIFDEERCIAIEEGITQEDKYSHNPFHTEQLALCSLEFLVDHPNRFKQAYIGNWDLLVVDEAHHLQWSPTGASLEYELIELLATETNGVLLLTATPEQLGKASHFARLRLLDPDRFPDLDAFIEEEKSYEPIAQAVEELLNDQPLSEESRNSILHTLKEGDNQDLLDILQDPEINTEDNKQERTRARQQLVEHLLDRHGTGRILFRNTRSAVKGFPQRQVNAYPLALPKQYTECLTTIQSQDRLELATLLCPELVYQSSQEEADQSWTRIDPRIDWLIDKIKQLKPEKVLLITANAQTVLDLAKTLKRKAGWHAPVFHEGMSIIDRDRAAAMFADHENGSSILLCSEIGSEGRNFQFAHHLVLFDLPLNPDLLEQRIGRLDRIGQTQTIQIHIPYLQDSAQELMYHWYHKGLSAFEQTCPAGHSVYVHVEPALAESLQQIDEGLENMPSLIEATSNLHQKFNQELQHGRDRLLEYNSCRPHIANSIKERALTQDAESDILDYLDAVFDSYGIDMEEHSKNSYIVRPGAHMQTSFPGLPEEGMTITCDRNTALANEDMQFITWEHPLLIGAFDLVLGSEQGNTALTTIKYKGAKPGTMLLECVYIMESASSDKLQSSRFLPPTTIRTVVDQKGNDHEEKLSHEYIKRTREVVDTETALNIIRTYAQEIRNMISISEKIAKQQAPKIHNDAHKQTRKVLQKEINRLKALHQINPNVRTEEINFFESQWSVLDQVLESTNLRLDAIRVMITT